MNRLAPFLLLLVTIMTQAIAHDVKSSVKTTTADEFVREKLFGVSPTTDCSSGKGCSACVAIDGCQWCPSSTSCLVLAPPDHEFIVHESAASHQRITDRQHRHSVRLTRRRGNPSKTQITAPPSTLLPLSAIALNVRRPESTMGNCVPLRHRVWPFVIDSLVLTA